MRQSTTSFVLSQESLGAELSRESWCRTFQCPHSQVKTLLMPKGVPEEDLLEDAVKPVPGRMTVEDSLEEGSRSHATRDGVAGGHAANRGWGRSGGKSRGLH